MISLSSPLRSIAFAGLALLVAVLPTARAQSTWSSADIGPVAAPGSSSGSGSNATVAGSGSDIWETSDEFHFRSQTWTGDGTFIVRVTGITNTHTWAKAGIMLRESSAPNGRHVTVAVNSGNAAGFFVRPTTGGATDFTLSVYEIASMWIRLVRSGNSFSAAQSNDGVNWVAIGSPVTVNLPAQVLAGLAVTSHNDGALCTATFTNLAFTGGTTTPTTPTTPPSGTFTAVDVGAVAAAGSTSESGGIYTLRGSGEDISGPQDEFHYYCRPWTGDGMFIARVNSVQFTANWARAGIMLRADLSGNSLHALAFVSPERHPSFIYRITAGGNTTFQGAGPFENQGMPMWIKLTREGDLIAADFSFDGLAWRRHGSITLALPETVYVGLVVNSHNDGTLCTATFDNFTLGAVGPTRLSAIARSATRVELKWTNNDLDAGTYEVERGFDNLTFTRVATLPTGTTGHIDPTASAATSYYYRVRSTATRGASPYSNSIAVTTPPAPPPGWSSEDVGDTAATGTAALSGGVFSITGAGSGVGSVRYYRPSAFKGDFGADVPGYSDEFHFCSQPWTGAGEIVARLTQVTGASTGHAGIMVRVGIGATAYNVFLHRKSDNTFGVSARPGTEPYRAEYRNETFTRYTGTTPATPPQWLKLVRVSDGVMAYASADGTAWTELVWISMSFATDVHFGLAVSSQQDGSSSAALPALLTASFDNVAIRAITTPIAPPAPPTNLQLQQVAHTSLSFSWTKPTTTFDSYEIERSTDGVAFTTVTTGFRSESYYTSSGIQAGTTYYFRVRAVRGSIVSPFSSPLRIDTPPWPAAPTNLTATALSSTEIRLNWTDNSTNENGFQLWRSINGGNYVFLEAVPADTTTRTVSQLAAGTTYTFLVNSYPYDANQLTPYANPASATTTTAPPTNGSWLSRDIGGVGVAGSESGSGTTVSLSGAGYDIWNTFDEFRFRSQPITGDAEVIARVASLTLTNGWAKAGLMFRESLSTDSRHAWMCISTEHGAAFQYRATTGGQSSSSNPTEDGGPPRWLKIVRRGNTFTGYESANGSTWTERGTITIAGLPATLYVGLAVTSHNNAALSTAVFENVTLTPGTTTPTPVAAPSALVPTVVSSTQINLAWTDNSTDETAFLIERSVGTAAPYSSVGTVAANVRTWSDTGLTPSTQYYYRVYARRNADISAYSGVAGAMTSSTAAPPAAPTALSAVATSSARVELSWTDNSTDETLFRIERSADGVTFANLQSVGPNITTWSDNTAQPTTTYYYRVIARRNEDASTPSNTATATTSTTPPGFWYSQDVGAVALAGSSNGAPDATFSVTGSGSDIWNDADEFRYLFQSWTGDGTITVRVTSLSNTNGWAKAGVMFRETLTGPSRHAWMAVSAAHGTAFQYRATTGGTSDSSPPSESGGVPRWLRLTRSGNTFTGAASLDGVNWTTAGSITLALPSTLYLGLAVTSHNDGVACTADFDNITIPGGTTSPTTVNAPTALSVTPVSSTQLNLSWTDQSTNETGFQLERSTDNTRFSLLTSLGANQTTYADLSAAAATTYYYRIHAVAGTTPSTYSNTASGTTSIAPPTGTTWSQGDVGSVGIAGSNTASGNTITVRGSGSDIWDTADGFRFVYRTITGDCTVEAQVSELTQTHGWAKAGVMIRDSTAANARNVFAVVTAANGVGAQARSTTGSPTTFTAGTWGAAVPYWVRLVRNGSTIVASTSTNGTAWTTTASYNIALNATVLVGFAVTSHNNAALATATFTDPFIE